MSSVSRRTGWVFLVGLFLAASVRTPADALTIPKVDTIFGSADRIWQAGVVRLSTPLRFRNDELLVFPAKIHEQLREPSKVAATIMFTYEVGEEEEPLYAAGHAFFAPIELLSKNAYWRDNLPPTRRHAALGGTRYVFREQAEMKEASLRLAAFLRADQERGQAVHRARLGAAIDSLSSTLPVFRNDAARYLADSSILGSHFPEDGESAFADFLRGDAPVEERRVLIAAVGRRGIERFVPVLRELADGEGDTTEDAEAALAELAKVRVKKKAAVPATP